jgi:hypothetical protein
MLHIHFTRNSFDGGVCSELQYWVLHINLNTSDLVRQFYQRFSVTGSQALKLHEIPSLQPWLHQGKRKERQTDMHLST